MRLKNKITKEDSVSIDWAIEVPPSLNKLFTVSTIFGFDWHGIDDTEWKVPSSLRVKISIDTMVICLLPACQLPLSFHRACISVARTDDPTAARVTWGFHPDLECLS
mmetsp:Transcript_29797/g.72191  ORF Transcript_29797/g.72191 Transcript_29797/m.72191 type:complete len:107 (+) Transcript_29797:1654-1974(+)